MRNFSRIYDFLEVIRCELVIEFKVSVVVALTYASLHKYSIKNQIKTLQFYSPTSANHGSVFVVKYCTIKYKERCQFSD